MAPWFFQLFGIRPQGAAFEVGLFLVAAVIGVGLLYSHHRAGRSWTSEWFVPLAGGLFVAGGLFRAVAAATGRLAFGVEGFQLPTYGVVLAGSLAFGIWLMARHIKRVPDSPISLDDLLDLAFVVIVSGMAGARLLSLATELRPVVIACFGGDGSSCRQALSFWDGGLAFYGGVISSSIATLVFCRVKGLHLRAVLDAVIPYIALGHAIGRLGCFAAGCCHGAVCDARLGVHYAADSHVFEFQWSRADASGRAALEAMGHSFPVHAAQLYESMGELLLAVLLIGWVLPRRRYVGQLFATWLGGYALVRFALELVRGDLERGFLFEIRWAGLSQALGMPAELPVMLSTSQAIALGMLGTAVALRWRWSNPPGIEPVRRRRGGRR
jgi:phosphatidylglycerol:prolipoprotein diacylglycerol transferase